MPVSLTDIVTDITAAAFNLFSYCLKVHLTNYTLLKKQEEEKESEYMHVCRRKRERPHDFYLSENMYDIFLPGRMQTEEWLEYLHQNPKTHQSDTHLAQ